MPDSDLQIRLGGGGQVIQTLRWGGGGLQKKFLIGPSGLGLG